MSHAETLAELVTELLDEVTVRPEWIEYRTTTDRDGRTHRHAERRQATRRDPGLLHQLATVTGQTATVWQRIDILSEEDARGRRYRIGHRLQRVRMPAAAITLTGAAVPGGSPGWDADGALSPIPTGGSFESEPPYAVALELLDEIADDAAYVHAELRRAAGHGSGKRRTLERRLRELVGLALEVDETTAVWALSCARSWVASCKVLLTYEARTIELERWHCPTCYGRIRTRADDTSLVWCVGGAVILGPVLEDKPFPIVRGTCGATWPKGQWVDFMQRQASRERIAG